MNLSNNNLIVILALCFVLFLLLRNNEGFNLLGNILPNKPSKNQLENKKQILQKLQEQLRNITSKLGQNASQLSIQERNKLELDSALTKEQIVMIEHQIFREETPMNRFDMAYIASELPFMINLHKALLEVTNVQLKTGINRNKVTPLTEADINRLNKSKSQFEKTIANLEQQLQRQLQRLQQQQIRPVPQTLLIKASQMTASQVAASQLAGSQLTASQLAGSQLAGSQLAASQLAGSQVAGSQLAASQLAGSQVVGSQLAASQEVAALQQALAASQVVASQLAASQEVAALQQALAASQVAASQLAASQLAASQEVAALYQALGAS